MRRPPVRVRVSAQTKRNKLEAGKWLDVDDLPVFLAVVAQLAEHQLPKLRVAGSSPVYRSKENRLKSVHAFNRFFFFHEGTFFMMMLDALGAKGR